MGVPGFMYWLITNVIESVSEKKGDGGREKQPKMVFPILTHRAHVEDVIKKTVDNFYIDLNGLIHPCCHPQIGKKPANEDEMMDNIVAELLLLARTVRPQNVFYIAVDGVAPAAKQEQQRHRRFVAITENEQRVHFLGKIQSEIQKEKKELENEQEMEQEQIEKKEELLDLCFAKMEARKSHWDHNVISPGTPFMRKCMAKVHEAAKLIAAEFPSVKVIVSDSSVPGEGEHKILSYMKREKAVNSKVFSDMVHIVHGLDADLIMLTSLIGLPNMYSYRDSENMRLKKREKELFYISELGRHFSRVIYSSISELDKSRVTSKIEWNSENFISDVVLLLMFVGNDFLPNVPSLVMHNHAASIIMYAYAKYLLGCLEQSGQGEKFDPTPHYVVNYSTKFMINIKNMVKAMTAIREESIIGLFAKLYSSTIRAEQHDADIYENPQFIDELQQCISSDRNMERAMKTVSRQNITHKPYDVVYKILGDYFRAKTKSNNKYENRVAIRKCYVKTSPADIIHDIDPSIILKYKDEIHNEYYEKKFTNSTPEFRKQLVREYLHGIVWTFNYYSYNEPPSWYWRYPHHYAPVMCDILDCLEELNDEYINDITTFEKGDPLSPYQQLVSILPKESMDACLPKTYTEILSNPKLDPFFPKNFEKDGNFTGIAYKAVSLLPSIDIDLVKNITKEIDPLLSEDELRNNMFGIDVIYTAVDSDINKELSKIQENELKEERFANDSLLSGVFSKIDKSEMVYGLESVQEEFKPSVSFYKFGPPQIPIEDAYKHVSSASIPKSKLICTLTKQLKGFNELGGFVSMSEDQDLNNLRYKKPKKTMKEKAAERLANKKRTDAMRKEREEAKRKEREEVEDSRPESRPKKASKTTKNQKTPLDKKSTDEVEVNEEESSTTERKPIKAMRDKKPAVSKRKQTRGTKRPESEIEGADSNKQAKKPAVEKVEVSSTTTPQNPTPETDKVKAKKKRVRNKKKKPQTPAASSSASATTTSTPESSAPVDNKQKLKESTNAKFKALLGKFMLKKD